VKWIFQILTLVDSHQTVFVRADPTSKINHTILQEGQKDKFRIAEFLRMEGREPGRMARIHGQSLEEHRLWLGSAPPREVRPKANGSSPGGHTTGGSSPIALELASVPHSDFERGSSPLHMGLAHMLSVCHRNKTLSLSTACKHREENSPCSSNRQFAHSLSWYGPVARKKGTC
jgi:hypothetical protein